MTEFEASTLFYQIVDVANASFANFLTVVFAMLVASYLAAHKLDRTLTILVLCLFTLFSFGLINEIYSEYRDFAGIGVYLYELAQQPGSSLGWHAASTEGADKGFKLIPYVILVMCSLAYLGSVWFFFHMKRIEQD